MIEYHELTPDEQTMLERAFKAYPKLIPLANDQERKIAEDLRAFGYLRDAFLGWDITNEGRELVKDYHERTDHHC